MADDQQPLKLFFKILDARGEAANLGHAAHVLLRAIEESPVLKKERDIVTAARSFAESHSRRDGFELLRALESRPFPVAEIVAGAHVIMAWLGSNDSELFVSRVLMHWQAWSGSLPDTERDARLLQAIGWLAVAGNNSTPGGWNYASMQRDSIPLHAYSLAQRIRRMTGLDRLLDATASPDDYQAVKPGDRYSAGNGGRLDAQHGLPEYLIGHIAEHLYRIGADGPNLTLAVVARRIAERFPNTAFRCREIIDNQDIRAAWELVTELEGQDILDAREEVEALTFALAQTGDRIALCRAAAYALRRAYHSGDTELIANAIGMLAVASGARDLSDTDYGCNPVQGAIANAGGYMMRLLRENLCPAKVEGKPGISAANDDVVDDAEAEKPDPDPAIVAANAASDEELQELATKANEIIGADISADDLKSDDLPPSALRVIKKKQAEAVRLMRKRELAERIRVIRTIGNSDVANTDIKGALRRLEPLLSPLQMSAMPADLEAWRAALLSEFPHAAPAIGALHGDLATRRMNGKRAFVLKPTLFVGAPGTGKSRMARRVAELAEMPYRLVPCGGINDSHFGGLSRGWHSGHPSAPLDLIRQSHSPNPVIVLDEIEKSGTGRRNGNLLDTILAMLEPETNSGWLDPYVQGAIDLSAISWIMTANSLAGLPAPLLDRLRIIHIDEPQVHHLRGLAASILADLAAKSGHSAWVQPLDGDEIAAVSRAWKRHKSIRHLQKLVEACLRARELSAARH